MGDPMMDFTSSMVEMEELIFPGEVTADLVLIAIIAGIFFMISFGLSLNGCRNGTWKEKSQPRCVWLTVFFAAICYCSASFFIFLFYVFVATDGNAEYGTEQQPELPQAFNSLFSVFYLLGILLNIYVWIQRLESTFADSVYGYSNRFILGLKIIFWFIVVFGFIALALFIVFDDGPIIEIPAIIFVLVFVGELFTILFAFIIKLVQLRTLAESRFNADVNDIDPASLNAIKKLLNLQLKLTILSVVQILTSLVAFSSAVIIEGVHEVDLQCIDVFIGFFCVYTTIKPHDFVYQKVCVLCIRCCRNCIKSQEIERRFGEQIQLFEQSQMGIDSKSPADPTAATADPSANGSNDGPRHSTAASTTMQTAISSTDAPASTTMAEARPSTTGIVSVGSNSEVGGGLDVIDDATVTEAPSQRI